MNPETRPNRVSAVNIVFLITILISVVCSYVPLDFLPDNPVMQMLFSQGILVVPAAIFMIKERMSYRETTQLRKMKISNVLLVILLGFMIQPVLTFINALSMVFSVNITSSFLFDLSGELPFLVTLFLVAVVPAVCEESVYRGFFFSEYRKVSPWHAVLISGLLFGIMHGNLNQFCYATVMGIVFALIIEATGSILSTMLIHFFTNAGSIVSIYLYPYLFEMVKILHKTYIETGDADMAQALEQSFGDFSLTGREWMGQMLSSPVELTLADVFAVYFAPAVFMGILSFFLFRYIAKRNGNWERIRGFVKKDPENPAQPAEKGSLMTLPLVISIAVGVVAMFAYEMLMRLPR